MDSQLMNKGLVFAQKRKKWIFLFAAFGFTGYGVYKVYHMPPVAKERKRFLRLLSAIVSFVDAVSNSAEAAGIVAMDLKEFLQSDSDEIPNSLKQISKITKSEEFLESISRLTQSITAGVWRAYRLEARDVDGMKGNNSGFYDKFVDKLFSTSGSGFASAVVGSFARNLVMAFFADEKFNLNTSNLSSSSMNVKSSCSEEPSIPRWVNVMCNDNCRELIGDCIQLFVSTAVAVFLDKTAHINTYDELFAGLTNPNHEKQVRDMLVFVLNGAVETLVKNSHQVLTSSDSSLSSRLLTGTKSHTNLNPITNHMNTAKGRNLITAKENGYDGRELLANDRQVVGWVSMMLGTLSVPSNRRFVLDVTGRVTFETVRSFLEFLLEKVLDSVRRSFDLVNEVVIDKGVEVVRYVSAKSSVIAAVCLSLCLGVLDGAWLLMPA
ncbi:hypothetical protein Nepgr_016697 [Nepenthes gracilis]|uniref:Protein PHLOEM PROTEIN 2-LIKE A10 n=1 Tax=Nepenthes gracilis TaxID=150966 RepID=A0AAD3SR14_NEPGR|nr:hypothetical protein Nepgr_016697 [Nepenthes gracilis]